MDVLAPPRIEQGADGFIGMVNRIVPSNDCVFQILIISLCWQSGPARLVVLGRGFRQVALDIFFYSRARSFALKDESRATLGSVFMCHCQSLVILVWTTPQVRHVRYARSGW